ncbi:phage protein, HK97 gp10 family [Granulicella rosea]|uniref:Phage protein, HK97 gp10 family n=2 Tax=Granulicella rosea TaxID=474952 RepID=A0A239HA79_9BACT|nr:phage protein, HK97 gp10 family [Granulicella rosea]
MWVDEMKSRVPVDTGGLRDSIKAKVSSRGGKNSASAKVSVGPTYDTKTAKKNGAPSQQPGVYGMFVEFGTKDAKATPFMRPTFDATTDKAVEIFANVIREDLGL